MKKSILVLLISAATLWGAQSYSSENHDDHKRSENEKEHSNHKDEHSEEEGHKHSDDRNEENHAHAEGEDGHGHGHEEEEGGSAIGPDKGIIEKAEAGFKLSPEAFKTIGVQTKAFAGGKIVIPHDALVTIRNERSVFRLRSDWYKRVKVEVVKKNEKTIEIQSSSFREGDQIILSGAGFLRMAEVIAEEGASHSHSH